MIDAAMANPLQCGGFGFPLRRKDDEASARSDRHAGRGRRAPVWAQTAEECVPSALNIPEAKYPCLYQDHRALFRVVAPDAQKVRVRIGPGFDMTKGPDGIWTVTTTPLVVGFHYYAVQIDGATIADPSTHTYFGSGWQNSAIEVPAPDAAFYEHQDVPHGRVSQQWYL